MTEIKLCIDCIMALHSKVGEEVFVGNDTEGECEFCASKEHVKEVMLE